MKHSILRMALLRSLSSAWVTIPASAAWEPVRPVEFIVPAGTGGGADQMARTIQGIVTKHNLMKQPMVVINKSGGAGGEGFLDVKGSGNNPHKIIITLSNLFTTPLATGIPFNWKDLTPVAMLALDEFVLWVNADKPYKTVKEYVDAVKAARRPSRWAVPARSRKTRSSRSRVEKATGTKFTYIPYKGGGEVAVQLVGNHVDSTVNNPIEAVAQWRGGKLRPLCVFDASRWPMTSRSRTARAWKDIPTCKSQGLDMEYLMLRGIFMSPKATKDQVEYYIELFKKVRATPEWQDFMKSGAFNTTFLTGADYAKWVETEEKRHEALMKEAGFLGSEQLTGEALIDVERNSQAHDAAAARGPQAAISHGVLMTTAARATPARPTRSWKPASRY